MCCECTHTVHGENGLQCILPHDHVLILTVSGFLESSGDKSAYQVSERKNIKQTFEDMTLSSLKVMHRWLQRLVQTRLPSSGIKVATQSYRHILMRRYLKSEVSAF